jgi:hypothetical protein
VYSRNPPESRGAIGTLHQHCGRRVIRPTDVDGTSRE